MSGPKKLPISQFKSWLEGVEEMQGDDWTPTIDQWKKIRAKIDALEDGDDVEQLIKRICGNMLASAREHMPPQVAYQQYGTISPPPQQQLPPIVIQPGASTLDLLPIGPDGQPKFATVMPSGASLIKTPNIDSSQGYNTPYV